VPDVVTTPAANGEQIDVLAVLPQFFDKDWEPCPDCSGRGVTVDHDGSLIVCMCMPLDECMVNWVQGVINRLAGQAA
jgi:hypothetical protein